MSARSPFAPETFPQLEPIDGVRLAAGSAGVKTPGRLDVMLAEIAPGTSVAGVLTRSKTRAAPVDWCAQALERSAPDEERPWALLVNSGNANAFNGAVGMDAVQACARAAADALGTAPERVFVASTGVIGEPLPVARITGAVERLRAGLSARAFEPAAQAIMTTDTFAKGAQRGVTIDGRPVRIAGIAKGSGMIAPDMATMLAFLFTDAAIAEPVLRALLRTHVDTTFNAITVDGDSSTSDTVLAFATGRAGHTPIARPDDPRLADFADALHAVMQDLAWAIVKDGEGASKFVQVRVEGAETDAAAKRIALSVANSPLVKTAIAGEDANWGRIVMAVGKAGEAADRDRLAIRFGDIVVARNGQRAPDYSEAAASVYMRQAELEITIDVGVGAGAFTVWTCDLTHGYVAINADYRT